MNIRKRHIKQNSLLQDFYLLFRFGDLIDQRKKTEAMRNGINWKTIGENVVHAV